MTAPTFAFSSLLPLLTQKLDWEVPPALQNEIRAKQEVAHIGWKSAQMAVKRHYTQQLEAQANSMPLAAKSKAQLLTSAPRQWGLHGRVAAPTFSCPHCCYPHADVELGSPPPRCKESLRRGSLFGALGGKSAQMAAKQHETHEMGAQTRRTEQWPHGVGTPGACNMSTACGLLGAGACRRAPTGPPT